MNEREFNHPASAATAWWRRLNLPHGLNLGGRRATLAELRRLDPSGAVHVQSVHEIIQASGARSDAAVDRIGLLATVLAHVDAEDRGASVAAALAGRKAASDSPKLHPLRFQRLLQADDIPTLHRTMVRAVRLLDGRVDVDDLAHSLYAWDERTKREWALAYYGAAAPLEPKRTKRTTKE